LCQLALLLAFVSGQQATPKEPIPEWQVMPSRSNFYIAS
jgi:hypothetical protein